MSNRPKMASFFFQTNSEADEERKVLVMQKALNLTREEWSYVIKLLKYEYDCNENPLALSASEKLAPLD